MGHPLPAGEGRLRTLRQAQCEDYTMTGCVVAPAVVGYIYSMRSLKQLSLIIFLTLTACSGADTSSNWIKISDFENAEAMADWTLRDTRNDTDPRIDNPQVTEIRKEPGNNYLIKKPAAKGIVGNRKALSYMKLPRPVALGETATFYTRINVEYFPNNHVFGLSNLGPDGIDEHDYNAFEPSIRVTDKRESNGFKNDGTLMVRSGKGYSKIRNPETDESARPLAPDTWYELWYVVDNRAVSDGGQVYDVYLRGGEFADQTQVFTGADFRMKREQPLIYFLTNCNTGPKKDPYGNGGLRYDDIYMSHGIELSSPTE